MIASDVRAYLDRIGYSGLIVPGIETLRGLQAAHLLSVPFENLDIHLGRHIQLDPGRLFDKIVIRRRGGFCYELNGLFAELLLALGFDVSRLAARVWGGSAYGIEFDHMALRVQLDEPYLADVGFGESYRQPLQLIEGIEQRQDFGAYRLMREGDLWRYDARQEPGDWQPQYRFPLIPHALADFQDGCDYQQTSPESSFTHKRFCSLATPDGRITLRDTRLIVTRDGVKSETPIAGEAEFEAALASRFGIAAY
jgi:N-hydroxyarylamine O-acetyltransferase